MMSIQINSQEEFYRLVQIDDNGNILAVLQTPGTNVVIDNQEDFFKNIRLTDDGLLILGGTI